jgi:hypothetical protein
LVQTITTASGATFQIPDGVSKAAFESGQISFLSGTPGAAPAFEDLTSDEIGLFDADLRKLAYVIALQRDLSEMLLSQRDAFLYAASVAKKQLNLAFGGLLKGGGFNMQEIRSGTILSNLAVADGGGAGTTTILNWKRTFSTTGWQALFGSQTDPVSLGTTGSSTTIRTTFKRVVIAAPYIISTGTSPLFAEIKAFVQQTKYPVYPVTVLKLSDMFVAKLPGLLLGLLDTTFAIEANIETTGDDEPQLYGIQFVTSDYANLET